MKNKILSVLLALMLSLSFSACAESAPENDINTDSNTESSSIGSSDAAEETASDTPAQTVTAEEETQPVDVTSAAAETSLEITTAAVSTTAQTEPTQTAATVPAVTEPPAPQWNETAASGTMYVNTNGIYSRTNAIQGSPKVKSYSLNQAVTVIAKTDTGYYKIGDGEYIHGDYLSSGKVTTTVTTSKPAVVTTAPAATTTAQKPPVVTTASQESGGNNSQRSQTQEELNFSNRVFELINAERAKEGLAPFKKMDTVTQVANLRAWEIIGAYGHSRPDGSKFKTAFDEKGLVYGRFAENIAAGQSTPEEVVNAWMNSTTHRNNILADYEYLGVGYYNASGSEYTHYWTQSFYSPQ